jgi:hypothetical protein
MWALWWEGYPISTEAARGFLAIVATDLDRTLTKVRLLLSSEDETNELLEKSISANRQPKVSSGH